MGHPRRGARSFEACPCTSCVHDRARLRPAPQPPRLRGARGSGPWPPEKLHAVLDALRAPSTLLGTPCNTCVTSPSPSRERARSIRTFVQRVALIHQRVDDPCEGLQWRLGVGVGAEPGCLSTSRPPNSSSSICHGRRRCRRGDLHEGALLELHQLDSGLDGYRWCSKPTENWICVTVREDSQWPTPGLRLLVNTGDVRHQLGMALASRINESTKVTSIFVADSRSRTSGRDPLRTTS